MKISIEVQLKSDINKVWNIVTDNKNYEWRCDLTKIDILDDGLKFIEYTKNGFKTEFTITKKEECKYYSFDIKNKNITGSWTGIFTKKEYGTCIDFTEEIYVKNPIMKLVASIYLKKQQKKYIENLKKALDE